MEALVLVAVLGGGLLWLLFGGHQRNSLRVAFIHPDLGIGGAERLVVDAALGLQQAGHQVVMFTSHHDTNHCLDETRNGTLKVIVHGDALPRSLGGRFKAFFAYLRNLYLALALVRSHKHGGAYDVIFVDAISASIPILKLTGAKILFYCHFPDRNLCTDRRSLLKRLYRLPLDVLEEVTTGQADKVLVNSKFTASVYDQTFTRIAARVRPDVLYPAINFQSYSASQGARAQQQEREPLFVSLNRYERKKNIGLALQAFALLRERTPSVFPTLRLVIAGGYDPLLAENVEHFKELKALAHQLDLIDDEQLNSTEDDQKGAQQVTFLRSISNQTRNGLLAQCSAIIYTPENEHFGIVPVEAMYAGAPVIACNSGGPRESIIHEAEEFAEAMALLADDPNRVRKMGEAGHLHAEERYSLTSFTQQLEAALRSMLSWKGRDGDGALFDLSTTTTLNCTERLLGRFFRDPEPRGRPATHQTP
ncbi:mannosyltransferase [Acanthamoeba castellanii str. Neff]|uniref:Alpha-1,3/1,6-mannosyltransferase ALG2 n=1 Tax=Acanthamoeba castellanii (strain ATCC 30010 / Neff) TaxID=1257118 RepID=L8HCL9_ACACF|nr:mannosyltransferase [Acanthamoeba castellanii str. Neff]ELR22987.1 mannosyltransferase [Acanthamoeba castellanii str. Neff]